MVKVRRVRTETPATSLGVMMFNVETGAPKIKPEYLYVFIIVFIVTEILLHVFFPILP